MRTLIPAVTLAAMVAASGAAAQPAPVPGAIDTPIHGWSAQAGYETFTMRDVSRNIRPPDASPISWQGEGPVVRGRYEINGRRSAHLFDIGMARATNFAYVAPTRTVDALAGDTASRFEGTYEYRRYFWRDLGMDGLDLGLGVQGIGTRVAFDRHITSALITRTRISGGGVTGVVSVRLRRWDLVHVDASWGNGAVVSARSTEHTGAPDVQETHSGGNWLTDTSVRSDWRLTSAMRLSLAWRRSFEGYSSSHYSYSGIWQSVNVGVIYAR